MWASGITGLFFCILEPPNFHQTNTPAPVAWNLCLQIQAVPDFSKIVEPIPIPPITDDIRYLSCAVYYSRRIPS